LGQIGWIFSLFFTVCAALRLARFNIENLKEQTKNFFGIPSPAAAGIVMIPFYLSFIEFTYLPISNEFLSAILIVFAGSMMISRVPTPSLKNIKLKSIYLRLAIVFTIITLIFLITYFWETVLILALAYLALAIFNLFIYFFRVFILITR
jgi:CDP-diacylglycerol--serine O-phosphatidyltransferase